MPNLSPNPSRFSERETAAYYDAEDALYRSVWDAEGSLLWGVFDGPDAPGSGSPNPGSNRRNAYPAAGYGLNAITPENSGAAEPARVFDRGCGNDELGSAQFLCIK